MARPIWYVNFLKKAFPNIKFIAKLTRIPILAKIFDLAMFEGDNIIYLPQDKVIPVINSILSFASFVVALLNFFAITSALRFAILSPTR